MTTIVPAASSSSPSSSSNNNNNNNNVPPWLQWPAAQPSNWPPGGDTGDDGSYWNWNYSGISLWVIVVIILAIILILVVLALIILLVCRYGCGFCCRGCWGNGADNSDISGAGPTECNWWAWCCCCFTPGCCTCGPCCEPYQPYRKPRPPPSDLGYVGGATRYTGRSIDGRTARGGGVDRVIVIEEEPQKEPIRRTLVRRQQLVGSYDDDSYSRTGRFNYGETQNSGADNDIIAVVHRQNDFADDYAQRPTAVAHLALEGGGAYQPGGGDIGRGYHSAAYDVVATGGTIRYPTLHNLR
jgi:hypothetical protein